MLLHRKSHQRLDLTNKVRATRSLEALGFACVNANPGWYYDGSVYRQAAADTCRFTSENGRTGLLVEASDTNQLLYSSEDNAAWVNSVGITAASATSIISGKTAAKYTAANTTDSVYQEIGVLSGSESLMMIVEQGTAATCDIQIYDQTAAASMGRARLTFSTGVVSEITGSPTQFYSYPVTSSGPNGGKVYILVCSQASTSAGNTRRVYFYPSTTAAGFTYWHHAQLSETSYSTSPIVTTSAPVTRDLCVISSTTIPSWWNDTQTSAIASYERFLKPVDIGALYIASDGVGLDYFGLSISANENAQCLSSVGGASTNAESVATETLQTVNTIASSQKDGFNYAAGSGTASDNGLQSGYPTSSRFDIGQALGAVWALNGRIFSIVVRPVALSSTELENYTS